jgi:hypothetical protein
MIVAYAVAAKADFLVSPRIFISGERPSFLDPADHGNGGSGS